MKPEIQISGEKERYINFINIFKQFLVSDYMLHLEKISMNLINSLSPRIVVSSRNRHLGWG